MGSLESSCPLEEWWESEFEKVVEEEDDDEDVEDEVDGFLVSLNAGFWLVKDGLTDSVPSPFFSELWVEGFLWSSLVSCILDTPAAPVAPDTLVGVSLEADVPAPVEDEVLVTGVLLSCLEDNLVPEPNLPG